MNAYQSIARVLFAAVFCFGGVRSFAENETNASVVAATNGSASVEESAIKVDAPVVKVEQPAGKVEEPPLRVERGVFLVENDTGRGTGFLMQDEGQVYFVSNMHVLGGGTGFSIKNVYGETVSIPDTVQVASDRDLIRFPVNHPRGFRVSKDYGFGDAVCAVGNSGGEGVLTRIDGTVMALGPKLVEVSCTFIPGNSGGPVLDKSNQVVCVSTYVTSETNSMPNWILEGSRFKETRRMAVRVDNVDWMTMSWRDFCREAAYVDRMDEYSDEIVWIVKSLSDDKFKMIYSDTDYRGIQDWIKSYNQYIRSFGSRLTKTSTGTTVNYSVSPTMKRSLKEKIRDLAELMDELSREVNLNAVTIPCFKEELEEYAGYFERSCKQMEIVVETLL
ncbi:MAG: serine protease [Pontiellaceae bacterium]|nr:serine protease [Pontiellaceae bacterium]